jgi:hypothetical protein
MSATSKETAKAIWAEVLILINQEKGEEEIVDCIHNSLLDAEFQGKSKKGETTNIPTCMGYGCFYFETQKEVEECQNSLSPTWNRRCAHQK